MENTRTRPHHSDVGRELTRPSDRFILLDKSRYTGPVQDLYNAAEEIDAILGLDNRGESLWPDVAHERLLTALDQLVLVLEFIEE